MAAFISGFAKRGFPVAQQLETGLETATVDMNALRTEIWAKRMEFWYRKVTGYPDVMRGAHGEAGAIYDKLTSPAQITMRDLGNVGVASVQIYGAFCIGEAYGRKSLVGYSQGKNLPDHD